MKFLILGASGFVGKHTFEYLQSKGYAVVGTQSQNKLPGLVSFNLLYDNIDDKIQKCLDKLHDSSSSLSEEVYAVIFSFVTQIDLCFQEKEISRTINVDKIIRLIATLKGQNIKIVFMSSSFVFDGYDGYYSEDHLLNPICEYGRHKADVERYIKEYHPKSLILRLDKIVGDNLLEKHLFSEWYKFIQEKKEIQCIEGQLFSSTYVDDIPKAILLACQNKLQGVFHIANTEFFTREELARQFILNCGTKWNIKTMSQQQLGFLDFRPLKTYLDSTKFVEATGMTFTPMRKVFDRFFQKIYSSSKSVPVIE